MQTRNRAAAAHLRGVEVEEGDSDPGHDGVDLFPGGDLRLLRDCVVRRVCRRLVPSTGYRWR